MFYSSLYSLKIINKLKDFFLTVYWCKTFPNFDEDYKFYNQNVALKNVAVA